MEDMRKTPPHRTTTEREAKCKTTSGHSSLQDNVVYVWKTGTFLRRCNNLFACCAISPVLNAQRSHWHVPFSKHGVHSGQLIDTTSTVTHHKKAYKIAYMPKHYEGNWRSFATDREADKRLAWQPVRSRVRQNSWPEFGLLRPTESKSIFYRLPEVLLVLLENRTFSRRRTNAHDMSCHSFSCNYKIWRHSCVFRHDTSDFTRMSNLFVRQVVRLDMDLKIWNRQDVVVFSSLRSWLYFALQLERICNFPYFPTHFVDYRLTFLFWSTHEFFKSKDSSVPSSW